MRNQKISPKLPMLLPFSIACIGLSLSYAYCLLSLGSLNAPPNSFLSLVFFDMWNHLAQLSLEVSPNLVESEGFWMGNKTTVYFLPLPAIVRGFLSFFNLGTSAVTSFILALLFFITASLSIWRSIYRHLGYSNLPSAVWIYRLGIVFFSLCTPMMAILAVPGIFWEAIIWGATTFICAAAISILLLKNTKPAFPLALYLVFAFACGATLFTRATFSFASCWLFFVTTIFLFYQRSNFHHNLIQVMKVNRQAIIGVALFSLLLGLLLLFNFLKWGNPFEFYPIDKYKMLDANELANFQKIGALSLYRIPENFAYFFLPYGDNFLGQAPFIQFGSHHYFTNIGKFNYVEPTLPLTLTIPATVLFAVVGLSFSLFNLQRHKTLLFTLFPSAICSLVPMFFILMHHAQSLRYAGDFMPALVIFSGLGLASTMAYVFKNRSSWSAAIFHQIKRYPKLIGVLFCIVIVALLYLQSTYWRLTITSRYPNQNSMVLSQSLSIQNTVNLALINPLLGGGWHPIEAWGLWSKGHETSSLLITPPIGNLDKYQLSLKVNALITASHPMEVLDITVNGQQVQSISIVDNGDHEILIPFSKLMHTSHFFAGYCQNLMFAIGNLWGLPPSFHQLKIELKSQFPATPSEMGINPRDQRLIGIGLKAVEMKPI